MIAGLIAVARAWPEWARRSAAICAAVLALALLWGLAMGGWKLFDSFNDREAVADHETGMRASVTQTELEAERRAQRNDQVRRAVRENHSEALARALKEEMDEQDTSVVSGPGVRAVMRGLRAQAAENSRAAP